LGVLNISYHNMIFLSFALEAMEQKFAY